MSYSDNAIQTVKNNFLGFFFCDPKITAFFRIKLLVFDFLLELLRLGPRGYSDNQVVGPPDHCVAGGGCLQKPWVAQVDVGLASIALDEVCHPRQLLELT